MLSIALALAGTAVAADAPDYRQSANWLCRPGRQDACTQDLDATVIEANGTRRIERFQAAKAPKFDCFYVYPTVSNDPGGNSDLVPGIEEQRVAQIQAARFRAQCRVFAPMYRQVTLTALKTVIGGGKPDFDRDLAYADVKAAWDDYLQHDNQGRGVVLIGHSQGSLVLTQLIAREIDGKPAQARLVSAMLIGSSVPVPAGKDVGGVFPTVPLCRSEAQSGCVVTYSSFRADFPPPADSRFALGDRAGTEAGCTNPAGLAGGKVAADAVLRTEGTILGAAATPRWTSDGAAIATPFVRVPGLISTQCVKSGKFDYLAVSVNGDPADPRTDTIGGDVQAGTLILRGWGLHLIDMNVVQGDLVRLAAVQARVWAAKKKPRR